MRDQTLQLRKEQAIKDDYAKMASEKKYTHTFIVDQVALKYHLKDNTVERIVWGEYDTRRKREAEKRAQQSSHLAAA